MWAVSLSDAMAAAAVSVLMLPSPHERETACRVSGFPIAVEGHRLAAASADERAGQGDAADSLDEAATGYGHTALLWRAIAEGPEVDDRSGVQAWSD